jgi:hypothetical protein
MNPEVFADWVKQFNKRVNVADVFYNWLIMDHPTWVLSYQM